MRKGTSPGRSNTSAQQSFSKSTPVPNTGQVPELIDPRALRHRYTGRALAALSIGCIAAFVSLSLSAVSVALFFATIIPVLIIDWNGFVTINGLIKWRSMPVWARIVVGYFALGLWPFVLPVYLFQAYQTYRFYKQQEPIERRRKIAEMEAELGFMPSTEGKCRSCQEPLQVGAEFCAYCGASVIQKPLICPKCATTTFSDAKWCPKCHHPLDALSQEAKKADAPPQEAKKANEPPQVHYL